MIRKTYYFEQPSYLSTRLDQLVIHRSETEIFTRPLEDAGYIIIDQPQTTLTAPLLLACAEKQVAIIICDQKHLPSGIWLPLEGHSITGGRTRAQLECSKPLKKQLWQATVRAKILNQGSLLKKYARSYHTLYKIASRVRSGDTTNCEASAASHYWKNWIPGRKGFIRDPMGEPPNYLLNYAYAILRSVAARCLVGSGLWPVHGLFHRNIYNHLPLADDIMEPYRPFADLLVLELMDRKPECLNTIELTKDIRLDLLNLSIMDVYMGGVMRPLQVAMQYTCASLAKCFEENSVTSLIYPSLD